MAWKTPADFRAAVSAGAFVSTTTGICPGYAQANLIILSKDIAGDFAAFARLNPKPCPVLEEIPVGVHHSSYLAPGDDILTTIPRYRIYRHGVFTDEVTDATPFWRDDMVSFLIGCSFSFEEALLQAGLPVRHMEMGCIVPMYRSNIPTKAAGVFSGPVVVSMRPMTPDQAKQAAAITARFPGVHGDPLHIGDPQAIGIHDINKPDYGDPVEFCQGEVPVFWACGVTPQAAVNQAKPEIAISHAPGHMLVTDILNSSLIGWLPQDTGGA